MKVPSQTGKRFRPAWHGAALFCFLLLSISSVCAGAMISFPDKATASITNIDTNSGLIFAKDSASGQVFQFRLTNPGLLQSLHVGQALFVDLANKWVSLDGSRINGNIVSLGPVDGAKPVGPIDGVKAAGPAEGGKPVGPVDGAKPFGPIDSAKPFGPIDSAKPVGPIDGAKPLGPVDGAKPFGPIDSSRPAGPVDGVKPGAVSCQITSIDASRSLATARDSQSGRSFQFRLASPGLFQSLSVGQAVFANFATHQVSLTLNGQQINGSIVSAGPTATQK